MAAQLLDVVALPLAPTPTHQLVHGLSDHAALKHRTAFAAHHNVASTTPKDTRSTQHAACSVENRKEGHEAGGVQQATGSSQYVACCAHLTSMPLVDKRGLQFVDDTLAARMQDTLIRYLRDDTTNKTMVLLSGDGNDNDGRGSLKQAVMNAVFDFNWKVEVWCWRDSCSDIYRKLPNIAEPGRVSLHFLDEFRHQL